MVVTTVPDELFESFKSEWNKMMSENGHRHFTSDNPLRLFLVSRTTPTTGCGEYRTLLVAAASPEEAIATRPATEFPGSWETPDKLTVRFIGVAMPLIEPGIIMIDYVED